MASAELNMIIRIVPDNETVETILKLLNLWQAANPDRYIRLVKNKDNESYEIIDRS